MTLEELIREAAARGLTHMTLYPVASEDRKATYWRASATPSTGHKYIATTSRDPVEAMAEVLKALPKAPKRSPPKRGDAQLDVTATVTEPINMDESAERLEEIDKWLPRT